MIRVAWDCMETERLRKVITAHINAFLSIADTTSTLHFTASKEIQTDSNCGNKKRAEIFNKIKTDRDQGR